MLRPLFKNPPFFLGFSSSVPWAEVAPGVCESAGVSSIIARSFGGERDKRSRRCVCNKITQNVYTYTNKAIILSTQNMKAYVLLFQSKNAFFSKDLNSDLQNLCFFRKNGVCVISQQYIDLKVWLSIDMVLKDLSCFFKNI